MGSTSGRAPFFRFPARQLLFSAVRIFLLLLIVLALVLIPAWFVLTQPVFSSPPPSGMKVPPGPLEAHVRKLSQEFHPRSYLDGRNLAACADYIAAELRRRGAEVGFQEFTAAGRQYRNVIGTFGDLSKPRWVVGAHYDACGDTPGADDNASGVAGLIELAGLLGKSASPPPVELVAYCLEEPPFFRSHLMGSGIHAQDLKKRGVPVRGVVVLEMIGYFTDEPGSQSYPVPALRLFYPSRGNFLALVGRLDQPGFVREFKAAMQGTTPLPVYSINAPASLPGVDFSDHWSYWQAGYPALMVTDTSFYRNTEYHEPGDTWDRLDYKRMADAVVMVFEGLRDSGSH